MIKEYLLYKKITKENIWTCNNTCIIDGEGAGWVSGPAVLG